MLKYLRIAGILIGMAANLSILREWLARSDLELRDMVGNIILRESLLVGGATLATGIILVSAWPAIVWCYGTPARRRAAREAAAAAALEHERDEIIDLLEIVRDEDDSVRYALRGGAAQTHAMALMARTKLNAMGFGPPLQTEGSRRGRPGDWKNHAALVIAHIEGYGIEASREACSRARAKAEADLGGGRPLA